MKAEAKAAGRDIPDSQIRQLLVTCAERALLAAIANKDMEYEEVIRLYDTSESPSLCYDRDINYLSAAAVSGNTDFIEAWLNRHFWPIEMIICDVDDSIISFQWVGQALVVAAAKGILQPVFSQILEPVLRIVESSWDLEGDISRPRANYLQVAVIISSRMGKLEMLNGLIDPVNPYTHWLVLNDPPKISKAFTPLMAAAMGGHENVVKMLLEKGASSWAVDELGKTAAMYSVSDRVRSLL